MAPNVCRKTHEDICWRSHQKKVFMIFVGQNLSNKIWGNSAIGEIRANILRTPKNLPAPTLVLPRIKSFATHSSNILLVQGGQDRGTNFYQKRLFFYFLLGKIKFCHFSPRAKIFLVTSGKSTTSPSLVKIFPTLMHCTSSLHRVCSIGVKQSVQAYAVLC